MITFQGLLLTYNIESKIFTSAYKCFMTWPHFQFAEHTK